MTFSKLANGKANNKWIGFTFLEVLQALQITKTYPSPIIWDEYCMKYGRKTVV